MSASRTVRVEILGEAKGLSSMFSGAEKAAGNFGGVMGKLGGAIGGVAKIAGGFVLGQGLLNAPGALMNMAQAAADDAASIGKLQQAVENAGETWDGHTGAINDAIAASQKLAFSDDETRNSLSLLTAQTGSSEEAIRRLSTAQNLARGTGMSLEMAAKLVGKVSEENTEVLKKYGITLGDAATEQDALNEIDRLFGGQAGKFAASDAGKVAILKDRWGEFQEMIGQKVLPILTALTGFMLNTILPTVERLTERLSGPLSTAFRFISGVVQNFAQYIRFAAADGDYLNDFLANLPGFMQPVAKVIGWLASQFGVARDGVLTFVAALSGDWSDNENIVGLHRVIGNVGLVIREQVIPAVMEMAAFFQDTLWPAIQTGVGFVKEIIDAFGEGGLSGALGKLGDLIAEVAPIVLEKLGELAVSVGEWITDTGLPLLLEKLGQWADAFGAFAVAAVPPMLENLAAFLEAAGAWIADEGLPLLFDKLQVLGQALIDWIGPRVVPVLEALGLLLLAIGEWIVTVAAPAIGAKLYEWGAQFVAWVQPQIMPLLGELGGLLSELGSWLMDTALPAIWAALSAWGQAFIDWVGPQIVPLLAELGKLYLALYTWAMTEALPKIVSLLLEWGLAFVAWIAPQIPPLLIQLGVLLMEIAAWATSVALPKLIEQVAKWAKAFIDWVGDVVKDLPDALADIASEVTSWIGSVDWGGLLYDAGAALVRGLISGIESLLGSLRSKVSEIADLLIIDVPGFSPPYDAGYTQGLSFMKGLQAGIESGLPGFEGATATVAAGFTGLASVPSSGGPVTIVDRYCDARGSLVNVYSDGTKDSQLNHPSCPQPSTEPPVSGGGGGTGPGAGAATIAHSYCNPHGSLVIFYSDGTGDVQANHPDCQQPATAPGQVGNVGWGGSAEPGAGASSAFGAGDKGKTALGLGLGAPQSIEQLTAAMAAQQGGGGGEGPGKAIGCNKNGGLVFDHGDGTYHVENGHSACKPGGKWYGSEVDYASLWFADSGLPNPNAPGAGAASSSGMRGEVTPVPVTVGPSSGGFGGGGSGMVVNLYLQRGDAAPILRWFSEKLTNEMTLNPAPGGG